LIYYLAAIPDRRFKFEKSSQLFIRVHDETLSIVACFLPGVAKQAK